jgi:hypothetical protein
VRSGLAIAQRSDPAEIANFEEFLQPTPPSESRHDRPPHFLQLADAHFEAQLRLPGLDIDGAGDSSCFI